MTKIDLKDRKILYELDLDCRQSLTQIGKKVGLKKDVVSYRVKKLEEEGVIKNYFTVIDSYKLGYNVFRIYFTFQYATPEIKNKIIDYLANYKHTWVLASMIGKYDLSSVLWIKDINDFYIYWENILGNFGDYFADKNFSIYVRSYSYKKSYLLGDAYNKSDRLNYEVTGGKEPVKIDELDYKILGELAENAKIPIIDLVDKLGCSSQTVTYRVKDLVKQGIIQAFRVGIDLTKFGMQHYKANIHLKEQSKRKDIISYMQDNPNLTFIGMSAGFADLELEFDLENSIKLNEILEDIDTKFPGSIRSHDYQIASKFHKVRCIPEF